MDKRIGVIGGSGLYEMDGLRVQEQRRVETPYGAPSDAYLLGELDGVPVAFLSRHGRGHRHSPSEVPYRANVLGFKLLGIDALLSVGAVGSLQEEIEPLHLVVPDQFFDRTRNRASTFFTGGAVGHVAFADPVCPALAGDLLEAGHESDCTMHEGGTYLCMEGPAFSTRAESRLYRSWGMSVIGMTNLTEAKLAREAEICYATLAMVCDYDCWHEGHDDVSAEMVLDILQRSVANAQRVIRAAVPRLSDSRECGCRGAVRNALLTEPDSISDEARHRLGPILDKYLERQPAESEGERQ